MSFDIRRALLAVCLAITAPAAVQAQAAPAAQAQSAGPRLLAATFTITDAQRGLDFYVKGLGLVPIPSWSPPRPSNTRCRSRGGGGALVLYVPKGRPATATRSNHVIFGVDDLRATRARLVAAGYELAEPLRENTTSKVLVAFVEDPDGNRIELVQLNAR